LTLGYWFFTKIVSSGKLKKKNRHHVATLVDGAEITAINVSPDQFQRTQIKTKVLHICVMKKHVASSFHKKICKCPMHRIGHS